MQVSKPCCLAQTFAYLQPMFSMIRGKKNQRLVRVLVLLGFETIPAPPPSAAGFSTIPVSVEHYSNLPSDLHATSRKDTLRMHKVLHSYVTTMTWFRIWCFLSEMPTSACMHACPSGELHDVTSISSTGALRQVNTLWFFMPGTRYCYVMAHQDREMKQW